MDRFVSSFSNEWLEWMSAASWQLALWFALVATAALLTRRASARLRYVLWTLVLLKAVLPPSIGGEWAIGSWGVQPAMEIVSRAVHVESPSFEMKDVVAQDVVLQASPPAFEPNAIVVQASPPAFEAKDEKTLAAVDGPTNIYLLVAWATGVFIFLFIIAFRYWRMSRRLQAAITVEEGPLRCALEQLAVQLNLKQTPELLLSEHVTSPFLMGLFRARIVLPMALPTQISSEEMEHVLLHELTHYKRHDLLIGWVQVFVQALYWFHPLVWLAGAQLRHERECACDEEALSSGVAVPAEYGKSLLQVLLSSRGQSAAAMGFLGVFERNTRIQRRLEEIMSQENRTRKFGWGSWLFVALFVFVCLPMATNVKAQSGTPAVSDTASQNFVDDPQLIGSWQAVDFVTDPAQFKVNAKQWQGDLFLKEITIFAGGKTSGPWTWKKGILWHPQDKTESKYEIREIEGAEYLFMPWMSGDVTQRGMKPQYYVLKKVATSAQATVNPAEADERAKLDGMDETALSTHAETAAAKGDLMEAIRYEMHRVLLRAREGNVWKDKIDLGPIYEKYKALSRPDGAKLRSDYAGLVVQLKTLDQLPPSEAVEYGWRSYHLASLMAQDLEKMDEAAQHLDKALELYPNTPYSDPAKQSKYQHLINERAGLIWDAQGVEAAQAFVIERVQSDPKMQAFYGQWWEQMYLELMTLSVQPFLQKVAEAQSRRQISPQPQASPAPALSAEQTARQFLDLVTAKEFDKAAAMFDATMKAALPVDQLRQTWLQTISSIGEFEQITGSNMMKIQGYDVLDARGKFARSEMILRVSVSADGKIAGFYILKAN